MDRFRFKRNILLGIVFVLSMFASIVYVFAAYDDIPVRTFSGNGLSCKDSSSVSAYVGRMININAATKDQLLELPGVGVEIAERILAYRSKYGAFYDVGELREIEGIGDKLLQDILPYICV